MEKPSESDDFSLIFGEPALLKGESRPDYDFLRSLIATTLDAGDDILSQLRVQEVTDSIWEGRRFKRLGTQMVESSLVAALNYLLQPACATHGGRRADLLAQDYYFGRPQCGRVVDKRA